MGFPLFTNLSSLAILDARHESGFYKARCSHLHCTSSVLHHTTIEWMKIYFSFTVFSSPTTAAVSEAYCFTASSMLVPLTTLSTMD